MDQDQIFILGLFSIGALEILLATKLLPAYYRFGLPIFFTREPIRSNKKTIPIKKTKKSHLHLDRWLPKLYLKKLSSHEALLQESTILTGSFGYVPTMRGYLEHHEGKKIIHITGYANWNFALVFVFLAFNPLNLEKTGVYTSISVAYFLAVYLLQASRYRKVALAVAYIETEIEDPSKLKMPSPSKISLNREEVGHCVNCKKSYLIFDLPDSTCPVCGRPIE